jgi:hypothetical protein
MNLMLINVSTRKFRRAVRLPEGDVPAPAGAGWDGGNEPSDAGVAVEVAVKMMFYKNCATWASRGKENEIAAKRRSAGGCHLVRSQRGENKVSTFGYYPGPIDYWMFITDWRNGLIAILLGMSVFIFGYVIARKSPALVESADALPEHPSPTISGDNAIDEVNSAASGQCIET